ncbi:MAG: LysM peptidoglycan-binding domain-containing protein [Gemmatimonadetes bacterium]|nr:LysM peptidoglycan-binding domain-containing protein [Gemmatimonadota bacterium]
MRPSHPAVTEGRATGSAGPRLFLRAAAGLVVSGLAAGCARAGAVEHPRPAYGPERGAEGANRPAPAVVERPGPAPAVEALPTEPVAIFELAAEAPRPWTSFRELEERVAYYIDYFTARRVEDFSTYLRRMGRYERFIRERLAFFDLPAELVFLPLIESGFSPTAVSRSGAAGIWQFMGSTARRYGLSVTSLVDERRDPIGSTDAALSYLSDLRQRFGSWFLALAAYNGGENRLERVLSAHFPGVELSDSLFWDVRRYLPGETREYVPRFVAAVRIASDPQRYGFDPADTDAPVGYEVVTVPDATSLDVIAGAAEVSQEEVEALNPHFVRGVTPVGRVTEVRVPAGRGFTFSLKYAEIPPHERVTFLEHRVRRGETLGEIARRYGVRLAELQEANPDVRPRRLQVGQRLIVPRGRLTQKVLASRARLERAGAAGSGPGTHVVEVGETLWQIARSYGVSVDELRRWNGLREDVALVPGQALEIRGRAALVYRVQPGDTLTAIARQHGLSAADLARFNNMDLNAVIRPGDVVRVPVVGVGR